MSKASREKYRVEPFPYMRRFSIDAGYLARKRNTMHGLLEFDVTRTRQLIHAHQERTGEKLSFTAFIVACLAQSAAAFPEVQAYRNWRSQLIIYEDCNINTMVEIEQDGRKIAMPYIILAANKKTFRQVNDEIRQAQRETTATPAGGFMTWFLRLPAFLRHMFYAIFYGFPQLMRPFSSSVLLSSVGMFGKGGGWGLPGANFPLMVTLGGIAEKPGVVDGKIEVREYLCVTLSFDHDIIDGAPAARFTQKFKELVESAYGFEEGL